MRFQNPCLLLCCLITTSLVSSCVSSSWAQDCGTFAETVLDEESLGLLRGKDTNAFAVFSKTRNRWSTYCFPEYLRIEPSIMGTNANAIIGFHYEDGPVPELVAVDTKGRFRKHKLVKPLHRELRPVFVGHGVLYYIADGTIYAFSGVTGTWDSLVAPHVPDVKWNNGVGTPPDVQKDGFDTETIDGILVRLPQGTVKFAADRGVWQLATPTNDASR